MEYIENPVCPKCKTSYPTNTKFCVNDGSKLVRQQDLIPKCVICNTSYSDDIKFCPRDGGEVKIILINHGNEPFEINSGDRIAQGVISTITPQSFLNFKEVDILSETDRNSDGFGTTGIK